MTGLTGGAGVRAAPAVKGVVVVGVDGSAPAARALDWAAEEARLRGARLRVVLAWSYLGQPGRSFDPEFGEDDARRILADAVAGLAGTDVACVAVNDLPARALLEASAGADMVVVGARGLGGFDGLLLGSVSQQVVQHASCPVVVVPRGAGV